jgi:oligoendopeptidase F
LPLEELTRFDAINLLGLGQFDAIFPDKSIEELNSFFDFWEIDLNNTPGLNLSLERDEGKSAQAMCFILQVPEEVYILMKPEGGWVDLETLWHELGHGLSVVYTSPELSIVERDMATSFSLSESFAFLLQNLSMTPPFLEGFMGLKPEDSKKLAYYKMLKDISIFRRYAAKFIAEFEMFSAGDLSDGSRYSELMSKYTGFYYQPESHLFDLVPEFYCLDYVMGWIAEAMLEDFLRARLGDHWMFSKDTGAILKQWWKQGNRFEINQFFIENGFGPLDPGPLLTKWGSISKY